MSFEARGHRSRRHPGYFEGDLRTMTTKTEPTDIGIITIRDDEFQAVLDAFPGNGKMEVKQRHYNIRAADAGGGARYRVAVMRLIEQGNGEAQNAARDMISDLAPRLILVVGIAGGLPHDDFTLGD